MNILEEDDCYALPILRLRITYNFTIGSLPKWRPGCLPLILIAQPCALNAYYRLYDGSRHFNPALTWSGSTSMSPMVPLARSHLTRQNRSTRRKLYKKKAKLKETKE